MKFTILGSCSGTEPMPGRRHESVALEASGKSYLFDAGDSCAYTAFNCGIDVTKLSSIFISHPHIDHIGGLPYLFFLIRKMHKMHNYALTQPMYLYTPAPEIIDGFRLLDTYSGNNIFDVLTVKNVVEGVIYEDDVLRVTAKHNGHLGETQPPYHSYSYLLEAEGKKIIYSGDIKCITELDEWLNCDLLIMETGHHDPVEVCAYLAALKNKPKKLVFNHHGRRILSDAAGYLEKTRAIFGENVEIAEDRMEVLL